MQSLSLDEDSTEVSYTIAGYVAKKLIKRLKCTDCQSSLVGVDTDMPYFHQLSRGGLTIPSWGLANIFCTGFVILDAADRGILQHPEVQARDSAEYVLSRYVQQSNIGCSNTHSQLCKKLGIGIWSIFFITTNNDFRLMQLEKNLLLRLRKDSKQKLLRAILHIAFAHV